VKMNDRLKRVRHCYICGTGLDPLTSNCPRCGYSQTPNPMAESASDSTEAKTKNSLADKRDDLRADLESKRNAAKSKMRSRLRKK